MRGRSRSTLLVVLLSGCAHSAGGEAPDSASVVVAALLDPTSELEHRLSILVQPTQADEWQTVERPSFRIVPGDYRFRFDGVWLGPVIDDAQRRCNATTEMRVGPKDRIAITFSQTGNQCSARCVVERQDGPQPCEKP